MAKSNYNMAAFFLAVLVMLLTVSIANARVRIQTMKTGATVKCDAVYGVQIGDTCFSITQALKLNPALFAGINPNLNCDALFVGQWLCVDGTAN